MIEGLQKLTKSEYWNHNDIIITCSMGNEVAELNIVRNMVDDFLQIMPYLPSYFINDKDIMFKSEKDAYRDAKIEEYYERIMIVLRPFIKLASNHKLSTIRHDLKVCKKLEEWEIELLVDWLLSPPFYHEFKSCAERSINEGKPLEEEIIGRSRGSLEFDIITRSGLHKQYPQVFADAKQHFLANYIEQYNVAVNARTGKMIEHSGEIRYCFHYNDDIYVADEIDGLSLYSDGQKQSDVKAYCMRLFHCGVTSVEAKKVMFYSTSIIVIDLETLPKEREILHSIEDYNIKNYLAVEKVALGSMGLVYLRLLSRIDNSSESNNMILGERVLIITSTSEMSKEKVRCRVSLCEIMERYVATGQLDEKDVNGKQMKIEHLMMFGRNVLVYYSLIQKKTNNDNSEDGDENGEGDNRVEDEDDTNKGLFVLERKENMRVVYHSLHKSQLKGSNISCRWAFVKNTPVVMFWNDTMHFEFFVLHSNGRLCTIYSDAILFPAQKSS